MDRRWVRISALVLSAAGLVCWIVMFLAGTDVWQDTGRPDFWNLEGAPYSDIRVAAYAFYTLFCVLVSNLVLIALSLGPRRSTSKDLPYEVA